MNLHDGHRPYPSRAFRVYKANAFGLRKAGYVFPNVSFINYSCAPNAEFVHKDTRMEVIAVKPIAKGEEVFISYNGHFPTFIRRHRQTVTRVYFGFECSCHACTLDAYQQALSDSRRMLLGVMWWRLDGFHLPDPCYWDFVGSLSPKQAEDPRVLNGMPTIPYREPINFQTKAAYSILIAKLLEAESLVGERLADAYTDAAKNVLQQMDDLLIQRGLVVMSTAKLVVAWMETGIQIQCGVRGKHSGSYRLLVDRWEETKLNTVISGPLHYLSCFRV